MRVDGNIVKFLFKSDGDAALRVGGNIFVFARNLMEEQLLVLMLTVD